MWYVATSASVTNGSTVVTINAGDDISTVQEGGGLIFEDSSPVEIIRAYLDGTGNRIIQLARPWVLPPITNQPLVIYPTDADFAAATAELRRVIDTLQVASLAEAEAGTDDEKIMTPLKVKQAVTRASLDNLVKADILQEEGTATDKVMSQKATTDSIQALSTESFKVVDAGTAATRDVGSSVNEIPDKSVLDTRLGTTGNLGTASTPDMQTATDDAKISTPLKVKQAIDFHTGTAATRDVGESAGNLMEVGAFGLGSESGIEYTDADNVAGYTHFVRFTGGTLNTPNPTSFYEGYSTAGIGYQIVRVSEISDKPTLKPRIYERANRNGTWTDWVEIFHTGNLGTAATRDVGVSTGNVMEVGAFGLGGITGILSDYNINTKPGFYVYSNTATPSPGTGTRSTLNVIDESGAGFQLAGRAVNNDFSMRSVTEGAKEEWVDLLHTGNTAVDSNGFIKAASPIIRVYSDGMREVLQPQGAEYEKVGAGHYLIKSTLGFAKEGWYIETPKDANGSVLFLTEFSQLENNDIEIKTYTPTGQGWKPEKGEPVDISEGRWIDIRLHEEKEEDVKSNIE